MRTRSLAALAIAALLAPLGQATAAPTVGAFASPNIEHVLNIPFEGAIGAKLIGDYMYVTGVPGLTIYDVSDGLPVPVGALALPHFENEQVDGNGEIVVISADSFVMGSFMTVVAIIDVTNPNVPVLASVTRTGDGHTATCLQNCDFLWNSGGDVWDIRNPAAPKKLGVMNRDNIGHGYVHNWNVDAAGFAWAEGDSVFDVRNYEPTADLNPVKLGASNYFGWHGSMRPYAADVTPENFADGEIDRGEVVYGSGEDLYDYNYPGGNCAGEEAVHTNWFRKTNAGYALEYLDRWSVGTDGTLPDQKPFAATFCSAHWIDVHENLLAVGWYEQGTRILDVSDPRNLRQVGYYMPVETQTWGSYFKQTADGLYLYSIDLVRGIDVLKFTGSSASPTVLAPHLNASAPGFVPDERFGWACKIPVSSRAI